MEPKVALQHEFIKNGFCAFAQALQRAFRQYKPDFPVFILNVGDEVYTVDMQKISGSNDAYLKTPRVVIDFDDFSINAEQLTSPFIRAKFVMPDETGVKRSYSARVKRIPLEFNCRAKLTCDNFLEQLKYIELVLNLFYKINAFSFQYLEMSHEGGFAIDTGIQGENKNIVMGQDSQRRNREIDLPLKIQLQYPSYDYYNSNSLNIASHSIKNFVEHVTGADGSFEEIMHVPEQ
jgi:hypothetical protein